MSVHASIYMMWLIGKIGKEVVKFSYVFVCLVHCLYVVTREGVCPFARVLVLCPPRWHNSMRRVLRCAVVVPRQKRRASRRNSTMLPPRDQNRCTSLLLIRSHLPLSTLPPVATHLTVISRDRNRSQESSIILRKEKYMSNLNLIDFD